MTNKNEAQAKTTTAIPVLDWVEDLDILPSNFTYSYEHDMFLDEDDEGDMLVIKAPGGEILVLWEAIVDWTTQDQLHIVYYKNREAMIADERLGEGYVSDIKKLEDMIKVWILTYR